jgi:hypothetical protein
MELLYPIWKLYIPVTRQFRRPPDVAMLITELRVGDNAALSVTALEEKSCLSRSQECKPIRKSSLSSPAQPLKIVCGTAPIFS